MQTNVGTVYLRAARYQAHVAWLSGLWMCDKSLLTKVGISEKNQFYLHPSCKLLTAYSRAIIALEVCLYCLPRNRHIWSAAPTP